MNNLKIFYILYFNANDIKNHEFFKKCKRRVFQIYYLIFFCIHVQYNINYIVFNTYKKIDIYHLRFPLTLNIIN